MADGVEQQANPSNFEVLHGGGHGNAVGVVILNPATGAAANPDTTAVAASLATLNTKTPALGAAAKAAATPVTLATDDPLLVLAGAVNETAPATDTASSGLNGRLQRVAQRLTSLIALLPASIGKKAAALSLSIALSTEDAANLATVASYSTGYSYASITTATTTLVKTGAGTLRAVIINSLGTVASVVQIYDGIDAGGTLLATIDSLTLSGTFQYDINFTVGLCVVTTGTVAPNVTVSYR